MTAATATAKPPTRRPQWWVTGEWHLTVQAYLATWCFAIIALGAPLVLLLISRITTVELSAIQFASHAAIWFPFSISIVLVSGHLTMHVLSGMTRRSFARGAIVGAVGTGLLYAVGLTGLLLIERAIYGRLGWFHGADGNNEPRTEVIASGLPTYFWGTLAICIAGTVSGLLVALAYYRWGGWWGTLMLPMTLAPLWLIGIFTLDADQQFTPWQVGLLGGQLGEAIRLGLALLVLAAGCLAVTRLTRDIPIAAKDA